VPTEQHSNNKDGKQFRPPEGEGTHNVSQKIMITFKQIIDKAKAHLQTVTTERSLYRSVCKSSRETLKSVFSEANLFQPPSPSSYQQPMSHEMTVHYSFDMA